MEKKIVVFRRKKSFTYQSLIMINKKSIDINSDTNVLSYFIIRMNYLKISKF